VQLPLQELNALRDAASSKVGVGCQYSEFFIHVQQFLLLEQIYASHELVVLEVARGQVIDALGPLVSVVVEVVQLSLSG
jgi:hypothetical protein